MIERIHLICRVLREERYAGIDESNASCSGCPAHIETPYGLGVPGCYLLASQLYEIAHGKLPFPRGESRD